MPEMNLPTMILGLIALTIGLTIADVKRCQRANPDATITACLQEPEPIATK